MFKRSLFSLLALVWSPGALYAQPATLPPALPADENKATDEDRPMVLHQDFFLRLDRTLGDPEPDGWMSGPFQDNALSLRGIDKEVARLGLSSEASMLLGGVLPVGFSANAQVRLRDYFGETGGEFSDFTSPNPDLAITGDYFSASLQGSIEPLKQVALVPSVRVERSSFIGQIGDLTSVNPKMSLVYKVGDRIKLRLSAGVEQNQITSAPALDGAQVPSDALSLSPTRSQNFDIGGEYSDKYLFLGANTFHRQITGVVESINTGEGRGPQLANVGDGFTCGMETEQRLSLGFLGAALRNVSLWSNQTLLISRVDDDSGVRRSIQGIPLLIGNAGLRYQNEALGTSVSASATYLGERLGALSSLSPELLLDVVLRQKINKDVSWFVTAENLTDQRQTASDLDLKSGIAAQELRNTGRTFFTGFIWNLGNP